MTDKNWPESERPREKLLSRGSAALSDAELVAVFAGAFAMRSCSFLHLITQN